MTQSRHRSETQDARHKLTNVACVALLGGLFVSLLYLDRMDGRSGSRSRPDASPVLAVSAHDLAGRPLAFATFKGKILVVNFWATWCNACRSEIPSLVKLQSDFRRDLQVIGVSEDRVAGAQELRAFIAERGINYPIVVGDDGVHKAFPPVTALPTTYLIDQTGTVVQRYNGIPDTARVRRDIAALIRSHTG